MGTENRSGTQSRQEWLNPEFATELKVVRALRLKLHGEITHVKV